MHGGSVEAHSAGAGEGSEFVVSLPLAEAPAAEGPWSTTALELPAGTIARRVLIADDNHDAAECLADMLRLKGHDVRTAYDGLAAIEAARAFGPDIVLLDLGMPRLNGYDAAPRIREHLAPGGRLVALTGWGQPGDRLRGREAGFDHHLIKPVDPAVLDAVLRDPLPG